MDKLPTHGHVAQHIEFLKTKDYSPIGRESARSCLETMIKIWRKANPKVLIRDAKNNHKNVVTRIQDFLFDKYEFDRDRFNKAKKMQ